MNSFIGSLQMVLATVIIGMKELCWNVTEISPISLAVAFVFPLKFIKIISSTAIDTWSKSVFNMFF